MILIKTTNLCSLMIAIALLVLSSHSALALAKADDSKQRAIQSENQLSLILSKYKQRKNIIKHRFPQGI